jgi:hypothetical protein
MLLAHERSVCRPAGGFVYQEDHIVVLAWGTSQKDIEAVWTILTQVGVFLESTM